MRQPLRLSFVTTEVLLFALLCAHAQTATAATQSELIAVTSKDGTRIGVE